MSIIAGAICFGRRARSTQFNASRRGDHEKLDIAVYRHHSIADIPIIHGLVDAGAGRDLHDDHNGL